MSFSASESKQLGSTLNTFSIATVEFLLLLPLLLLLSFFFLIAIKVNAKEIAKYPHAKTRKLNAGFIATMEFLLATQTRISWGINGSCNTLPQLLLTSLSYYYQYHFVGHWKMIFNSCCCYSDYYYCYYIHLFVFYLEACICFYLEICIDVTNCHTLLPSSTSF